MRLFGKNIPDKKKVPYALRYIVGIGKATADRICAELNIDPLLRADELTEEQCKKIEDFAAANNILTGDDVINKVFEIKKAEIAINTYRSSRWVQGLPVCGNSRNHGATARRSKGA